MPTRWTEEQLYRLVVESIRDYAIFMLDTEGRVVSWNKGCERIKGWRKEQVMGEHYRLFFTPEDRAGRVPEKQLETALDDGRYEAEGWRVRPDGSRFWTRITIAPIRGADGALLGYAKVCQDLTDKKAAIDALRESEERYRAIIENSLDIITILDADGRILFESPSIESALGYRPDELIGRKALEYVHADDVALIGRTLEDGFLGGGGPALREFRFRHKDGSWRVLEGIGRTFVGRDGRPRALIISRDITESRGAEEALKESEAAQRRLADQQTAILNALPAHVALLDHRGVIMAVNASWKRFARENAFPEGHLGVGENYLEVCEQARGDCEAEAKEAGRGIRAVLSGEKSYYELEYPCHSPSEKRWFRLMVTPLQADGSGGAVVTHVNVTERRLAEEELQRSEAVFRALIEQGSDVISIHNEEGIMLYQSPSIRRVLGYEQDELLGQRVTDYIHPDDVRSTTENIDRVKSSPGVHPPFETRFRHRNGSWRWFECTGTNLVDNPAVGSLVFNARDITGRKAAEAALHTSEQILHSVVTGAPVVVFALDREGVFTLSEGRALEAVGLKPGEAVGRSAFEIYRDNPTLLAHLRQALDGEVLTSNTEVSGRTFQTWYSPRRNTGGEIEGVLGVATDVTERMQLEEQLRQAQRMEAVGRLAGGVAHDFNNLLTAINGYADLSLKRLSADNPLYHNLEEIRRAGERAASLTRQLLAFSRRQILQPKIVNLNSVVTSLSQMLRRLIGEDIELRAQLDMQLGQVRADPGQLEQVLMNLAVNARDAMPEGGQLLIETKNVVMDEKIARQYVSVRSGPHVLLTVSDTGTGMNEETRRRAFEPFFTTKGVGKGTGLGLSTVYGIIKQSDGYIAVESEEGRGTTFKIYLPRVDEVVEAAPELPPPSPRGSEVVLIVEDEGLVREMTRTILRESGYHVLQAADGAEALDLCATYEGTIHLLLTDVVMPGMSGAALAVRAVRLKPGLKVLYMSGYTDDAIVHHGVLEEGVQFLQKPFMPHELALKVRHVLDSS